MTIKLNFTEVPYQVWTYFIEASSHDRIKMTGFQLDFDRKIFTPTNLNVGTWPIFTTPTNINFTPKKYAGAVDLDRSPSLASPVALLLYKKKYIRRTPDIRLRFVSIIRFVGFNFGHVKLLRFVVVIIRSYSFVHLESVKLIFLILFSTSTLH